MNYSEELYSEAMRLIQQGQDDMAQAKLRQVLENEPDHAPANFQAGSIAARRGEDEIAYTLFKNAIKNRPPEVAYYFNLATICSQLGRLEEAEQFFLTALEIQPNLADAVHGLAGTYLLKIKFDDAENILLQSLKKEPDDVHAMIALGNVYSAQGLSEKAYDLYNDVFLKRPDLEVVVSNKLFSMLYTERWSAEQILKEHISTTEKYAKSLGIRELPRLRSSGRVVKRPLRVGYVSSDFRRHSVAYFFINICAHHNRENVKVFCYYSKKEEDLITTSIQRLSDGWRSIYAKPLDSICRMIVDDKIDILVDLNGHCGTSLPSLFMAKPAPIQVNYLGYPCTTGIKSIDYRITDACSDPDGEDVFYTEKLVRLPGSFLSYYPPPKLPALTDPPYLKNKYITFGSFNNMIKISSPVVSAWAKILKAVPDSRLILKSRGFGDKSTVNRYIGLFERFDIDPSRISLLQFTKTTTDHLCMYGDIDIALDPFPYNGTTTTLESLIMGVPVVVLKGKHHRERVGFSILSNINCNQLIAETIEQYCSIAVSLSSNIDALTGFRSSLRNTVLQSAVCDGPDFTRKLEAAYKEMWSHYCAESQAF